MKRKKRLVLINKRTGERIPEPITRFMIGSSMVNEKLREKTQWALKRIGIRHKFPKDITEQIYDKYKKKRRGKIWIWR